jgi:hypothetical protein
MKLNSWIGLVIGSVVLVSSASISITSTEISTNILEENIINTIVAKNEANADFLSAILKILCNAQTTREL